MNFKIGQHVKIGADIEIDHTAHQLVYRIDRIDDENHHLHHGTVVHNPNGWFNKTIGHEFNPGRDVLNERINLKGLYTWNGVKIGDKFTLLEACPDLTNLHNGEAVEVIDRNHTGFKMRSLSRPNKTGYVYYPYMVCPLLETMNNEQALFLLEEDGS